MPGVSSTTRGLRPRRRRDGFQHLEQAARVFVHRAHRKPREYCREDGLEHLAILQDVRDAGRHAQVVLENVVAAVAVAHQVGPGDVAPDAPRRIQAVALFPVGHRGENHLGGNHSVAQDLLVVIDIVDEGVEGVDPLLETALDVVPLGGGHDSRDQIEREDALGSRGVSIDVEGDAHLKQQTLGGVFVAQQMALGQGLDRFQQKPGMPPGRPASSNISS